MADFEEGHVARLPQGVDMEPEEPEDRVWFYGNWRDFAKIVAPNLLLTIATLGIYRFWALTRERQYLWSHTILIDQELTWTGTGQELFKGFLLATVLFGGPIFVWQFGFSYLLAHNHNVAAFVAAGSVLLFFNYVVGVARFRALRYRLSRTYWHGIRGGAEDPGFSYGFSNLWKWGANYVSLGFAIPWTMITLWNDRWREMSFGQFRFEAGARVKPVLKSFFMFYLVPIFLMLLTLAAIVARGGTIGGTYYFINAPLVVRAIIYLGTAFVFYWFIGIIFLNYYSSFYKEALARLKLGQVGFQFEVSAGQWMKLYIMDAAITIGTLGIGWFFLRYRHWKFFVDHLGIVGNLDLAELHQSNTREGRHGEGLLDAIDIGAF